MCDLDNSDESMCDLDNSDESMRDLDAPLVLILQTNIREANLFVYSLSSSSTE